MIRLFGKFQRIIYSSSTNFFRRELRKKENEQFLKFINSYIPKNGIVVDIGCGPGRFCELLSKKYPDLVIKAIDSVPGFLGKNKNNLRYLQVNAESLPFQDESIDVVYLIDVLHHIKDKEKAVSEIARILKKDGVVIFRDIVNQGFFSYPKYKFIDLSCFYYSFYLPRYWSREEWVKNLGKHNLNLIKEEESTDGLKYLAFKKQRVDF